MRQRRAFTLIELLVVIAIIVALLAILLPSMNRAMGVAQSAVCGSNQRQLQIATMSYTASNKTVLPGAREWVDNSIAWYDSWKTPLAVEKGLLFDYVGRSRDLYLCPTFLGVYATNPANSGATAAFSYTMNIYFIRPGQVSGQGWAGYPSLQRIGDVVAPSNLFLYAEENPWLVPQTLNALNDPLLAPSTSPAVSTPPFLDALATYHLGKDLNSGEANAAFFDGHVSMHDIYETYIIGTPQNFR